MSFQEQVKALEEVYVKSMHEHGEFTFILAVTFVVHELAYFGAYLPFFVADFIPGLQKYKIQQTKENDAAQQWKCLRRLLFNHFFVELPLMMFTHPILAFLGLQMEPPFPSMFTLAWTVAACYVLEDFYFYWIHRLLHQRWFYINIHKVHHDHAAPFGMAAEYAHPVETVFLGFGTIMGPILFARHAMTVWVWIIFRTFQTVEVHSGYDFPWSLNNWIPGWGGAEFHDFHHRTFMGNYSSTFRWMDRIFGTDTTYRSFKQRQASKEKISEKELTKEAEILYAEDKEPSSTTAKTASSGSTTPLRRSSRIAQN